MAGETGGHRRITQLDGLRACAVIAVFLSHAFKLRMLWIGVDMFFVLSGFLITGILMDLKHKDLKGYFADFYERRARRILPPYVMILVVVGLIFGWSWLDRWYMYAGLQNYILLFPNPIFEPLNPMWSLAVEEQFYLFWPFAIYFLSDKKIPYFALSLMILAPIFRVLMIPYDKVHQLVYMGLPTRMDCLAMGSLLTFAWRARPDLIRKYGFLGLIPVVLTPIVMIKLSHFGGWSTMDGTIHGNIFTYEIALTAATGAFLWALGGRYVGILKTKAFQYLGRISYSFYLVHLVMIMVWQKFVSNKYEVAALAFACAVLYSTVSWYWYEKPIMAGGNRRAKQIELAAAEAGSHGA
jgi:peptidoglycan/LPS O-acetylase OafA/YrhL